MKMTTTLTHFIDNIIGLSVHGKVDFAKKKDNAIFGVSLSFGSG